VTPLICPFDNAVFEQCVPLKPTRRRYRNLDRLIAAVNADGRLHARYSTPDEYAAAKRASNVTWPMKFDDFFPYSSDEHEVWR
jgi:hypothetical protein